jgi:hypothetical protein
MGRLPFNSITLLLFLQLAICTENERPWQPPGVSFFPGKSVPESPESPGIPGIPGKKEPVEELPVVQGVRGNSQNSQNSQNPQNSQKTKSLEEEKKEKRGSESFALVVVAFFPAATGLVVCGTLIVSIFAKFYTHFFQDDFLLP